MKQRHATPLLFENLFAQPLKLTFDEPHTSSDGGAVLVEAINQKMDLTSAFTEAINDSRQPGKVKHTIEELVRQRIFALACGYPDGNDAARLADDPVMKLLAGIDARDEESKLASQATLSRFENAITPEMLFQIGTNLAERVIEYQRHRRQGRRKPKRITIDIDPTDDPTYGQQTFTFFNSYYDNWCYLPLTVYISFDDEPQQYLVGVILRPGNAPATMWTPWVLRRLVETLRAAWKKTAIRVRLDGGFAAPGIFDLLEWLEVEYLINMAKNSRLEQLAQALMAQARQLHQELGGTQQVFGECLYAAHSWQGQERRVIIKAEVVAAPGCPPRDNPRFVVTNMSYTPKNVYKCYRQRGDVENRIKELLDGLEIDRTSCTSFFANTFRVLLTTAAYMLIQALRDRITDPQMRCAQVWTLREKLFKIAARVKVTCRHIHIALPETFAYADIFSRLARALGAIALGVT
jgi:hypothetical protein